MSEQGLKAVFISIEASGEQSSSLVAVSIKVDHWIIPDDHVVCRDPHDDHSRELLEGGKSLCHREVDLECSSQSPIYNVSVLNGMIFPGLCKSLLYGYSFFRMIPTL